MAAFDRSARGVWRLLLAGASTIVRNLSLAVLAVALAISLWLFVIERENPKEARAFNSAIPIAFVNVPNGLAVANTSETSVRIRIEANESELNRLEVDDFEATVDLGGAARGVTSAVVDVRPPNGRIDVIDVTPSRVNVTLEDERSKEVPVKVVLVGTPQQGFEAVAQSSDPERVTVSGPESVLELVDAAVAEVNLTGLRVDVRNERTELKPRDARGGELSRVTVNPPTAQVSVELEQKEFSLTFVVNPTLLGAPAAGYNITGVTVDPRLVTVSGPLDVLESIDAVRGIATEEISLADARDDVVRTVQVVLPDRARLLGSTSVRVEVRIEPARGEFTFQIAPQVRNVGDGLAVTLAGPITITLAGEIPILETISPESILVTVDAQGLGAGLYSLPLQITAPAGTTVVRVEPAELGLALTPRP